MRNTLTGVALALYLNLVSLPVFAAPLPTHSPIATPLSDIARVAPIGCDSASSANKPCDQCIALPTVVNIETKRLETLRIPCSAVSSLDPNGQEMEGVVRWLADKCGAIANGDKSRAASCINEFTKVYISNSTAASASRSQVTPTIATSNNSDLGVFVRTTTSPSAKTPAPIATPIQSAVSTYVPSGHSVCNQKSGRCEWSQLPGTNECLGPYSGPPNDYDAIVKHNIKADSMCGHSACDKASAYCVWRPGKGPNECGADVNYLDDKKCGISACGIDGACYWVPKGTKATMANGNPVSLINNSCGDSPRTLNFAACGHTVCNQESGRCEWARGKADPANGIYNQCGDDYPWDGACGYSKCDATSKKCTWISDKAKSDTVDECGEGPNYLNDYACGAPLPVWHTECSGVGCIKVAGAGRDQCGHSENRVYGADTVAPECAYSKCNAKSGICEAVAKNGGNQKNECGEVNWVLDHRECGYGVCQSEKGGTAARCEWKAYRPGQERKIAVEGCWKPSMVGNTDCIPAQPNYLGR